MKIYTEQYIQNQINKREKGSYTQYNLEMNNAVPTLNVYLYEIKVIKTKRGK